MHRSTCLAVSFVLSLAGCGGPTGQPEMAISFQSQALLAEADLVAIYFYGDTLDCTTVREAVPRPNSILGPYMTPLDGAGRESGIVSRIDEVPVGSYVVFVDALKNNGENVGSGCAARQQVRDRKIASIRIVITSP